MGYLLVPDLTDEKVVCQSPCSHFDCKATRLEWTNAVCKDCGKPLQAGKAFYYIGLLEHQCFECAHNAIFGDKGARGMRVQVTECPKCNRRLGENHKAITEPPALAAMEHWIENGVAEATDGCRVEPDGICPHGHSSWLLILGYI